jgi:hypothetical protein
LIQAVYEGGFGFLGQLFQLLISLLHVLGGDFERPFLNVIFQDGGIPFTERTIDTLADGAQDNGQRLSKSAQCHAFKGVLEPPGELIAVFAGGEGFRDDVLKCVVFLDQRRKVFSLSVLRKEVGEGPLCRTSCESGSLARPLKELHALEDFSAGPESGDEGGNVVGKFPNGGFLVA